ncbi:hypothetical protein [Methylobacterium isbiliense]|uniref:GcrA cell cycle regulator n=1 Tax=Methylobacterium isbiliense TaxID=315478 RepID=A0ABQ4SGM1_9HYPH|nr:hypothetical protein [Methylobacterium isbiliense]MDN3621460.1 hypothetical protein [Methylobacterium isbiliense]GJE00903.1 hypothetical protein GMJLKIPL_2830 [Methylobacterium isbiliense]
MITLDGISQPISEWALDYGIPTKLIRSRLKRGWSEERAVTEPMVVWRGEKLPADAMLDDEPEAPKVRPPAPRPVPAPITLTPAHLALARRTARRHRHSAKLITFRGVSLTCAQWASCLGISPQAMHVRLKTKPLPEALTPPPTWRIKGSPA